MTSVAQAAPIEDAERGLRSLLQLQREASRRSGILSREVRRDGLERLAAALVARRKAICDAIDGDFGGRSPHETLMAEVHTSVAALRHAARHLAAWMRPRPRRVSWTFQVARARVVYQPLGVVGIVVPWNYPLLLAISPLAGVLAAGNRAMIKPSPAAPRLAELLAELVADTFPAEHVTVVKDDGALGPLFSALPFDHLVFTGSSAVGRQVMRAASANLCPVTLELGGKSPAIVARDYPLERAVASVIGGKLFNAGQTCIAPDYLLLPQERVEAFVEAACAKIAELYPRLGDNPDYTSIVDERHARRLQGYLDDARARGATVVAVNPAHERVEALGRKMVPALLLEVTDEMLVMQEEIFGPLLPIVPYGELTEAIDFVNDRPRPLALYVFSNRKETVARLVDQTLSGGVCVNETLVHATQEELPFGGVGTSGIGQYHGFEGFATFSKARAIFEQGRPSTLALLRPPYGRLADRLLGLLLRR